MTTITTAVGTPDEGHTVTLGLEDGTTRTITVVVPVIEQRTEPRPDLLGGPVTGLYAEVHHVLDDGGHITFFMSRLVGEEVWVIDAKFGANSFPHFSHGFGSRVTIPSVLPDEVTDVLDLLAVTRSLAVAIGRDVPLELPS
ncbi:hypothetical protein ACFV3E_40820 [Streptomyces sp. NPDC059718]